MKLVMVLCGLGCCIHLVFLHILYFKYETASEFTAYMLLEHPVPHTTACFVPSSPSTANSTYLERKLPSGAFSNRISNQPVNVSTVITDCRLRNFTTMKMDSFDDCASIFTATLFTRLDYYNCYTFNLIKPTIFSSMETVASVGDQFILYGMSLQPDFVQYDTMTFMNHLTKYPDEEIYYAFDLDTSERPKKLSFYLIRETVEFISLKSPYPTDCVDSYPRVCETERSHLHPICAKILCDLFYVTNYIKRIDEETPGIKVWTQSLDTLHGLISLSPKVALEDFFVQIASIVSLYCSLSICWLVETFFTLCRGKSHSSSITRKWLLRLKEVSALARINLSAIGLMAVRDVSSTEAGHKQWPHRLSTTMLRLLVTALCLREVCLISIDYFKYRTSMEIGTALDLKEDLPSTSYCINIYEWFKYRDPDFRYQVFDEQMTSYALRFNATLREIFSSVPPVDSVIKECRVRPSPSSPLITETNCSKYFTVRLFYQHLSICYMITPRLSYGIDLRTEREDNNHPSLLYSIVPSESLARISNFQLIVSHGLPASSRSFAFQFYQHVENQLIILSFFTNGYSGLPAPYDTDCSPVVDYHCRARCINSSGIGYLHYSEMYDEPQEIPIVSYVDMKNHTFSESVARIETECGRKCKHLCIDYFTRTIPRTQYWTKEEFEFAIVSPLYPMLVFETGAIYSLYDFIYQLSCSFSFWLGLSLIGTLTAFIKEEKEFTSLPKCLPTMSIFLERAIRRKFKINNLGKARFYRRFMVQLMKLKKYSLTLLMATCFFVHAFVTIRNYLKYPVKINTRLTLESNFTGMRSTICMSIDQLDLKGNFSLRNIWRQSPKEDEIILECGQIGMVPPNLSNLPKVLQARIMPQINSSSLCNKMLRVKKLVALGMVCYEIMPRVDVSDAEHDAKYHLQTVRVHHYLILRSALARYNLTVTVSLERPITSALYSAKFRSSVRSQCQANWIGYTKYFIETLPYPYRIGVLKGNDELRCLRERVDQATKQIFNRLSFYGTAHEPSGLIHETVEQSASQEALEILRAAKKSCANIEYSELQRRSLFQTYYDGPFPADCSGNETATNLLWFRYSDYLITHVCLFPAVRLIDLILYIGNLYGMWFGLSALQTVDALSDLSATSSVPRDPESSMIRLEALKRLLHQQDAPTRHHRSVNLSK